MKAVFVDKVTVKIKKDKKYLQYMRIITSLIVECVRGLQFTIPRINRPDSATFIVILCSERATATGSPKS